MAFINRHDHGRHGPLSLEERITLDLLISAAACGAPCPTNIDIEVACDFDSSSMGPKMVRKLEARGLIRVERYQRFRVVEIVATGQRTGRHPSMRCDRPLVRKGEKAPAIEHLLAA